MQSSFPVSTTIKRKVKGVRVPFGNNPFKLVACDMDGTLLNSKHTISDATRRVISELLARGVHFIFATGRPFTDVNRIKKRLNIFAVGEKIAIPGVQVMSPVSSSSPINRFASVDSELYMNSSGSPINYTIEYGEENYPVVERIVPRCFAITSNGACVYNEYNERMYEQTIQPEVCHELYSMFMDDPDVNINIFRGVDTEDREKASYINLSDTNDDKAQEEWISRYPCELEAALYQESHFTCRVVPDLEKTYPTNHVNEIFFLCYDQEKSKKIEAAINTWINTMRESHKFDSLIRVAPSAAYCLDIVPENVSKASALEFVVDKLGITMNDCIAFGDGLNDVEMLSSVGKGCIMQNANPRLKSILPNLEVIGNNNDDGVAKKLIEIFDLEEPDDDSLELELDEPEATVNVEGKHVDNKVQEVNKVIKRL